MFESLGLEPQWKDVCIVRLAEIGWPAYNDGGGPWVSVVCLANGVESIRMDAAATIFFSINEGVIKIQRGSSHS